MSAFYSYIGINKNITVGAPLLGLYHSSYLREREREREISFDHSVTGCDRVVSWRIQNGGEAITKVLQKISRALLLVTGDELDS